MPGLEDFPTGVFDNTSQPWPEGTFWDAGIGVRLWDENGNYLAQAGYGGYLTSIRRVPTSVPEPGTWAMMVAGLLGVVLVRRRRVAANY